MQQKNDEYARLLRKVKRILISHDLDCQAKLDTVGVEVDYALSFIQEMED